MKLPRPSPRQVIVIAAVLLLLAGAAVVARRSGPFAPVRVTVTQPVQADVAPALFGIGTVEARRSYLVGPTTAARVLRVLVDVGDPVKAGQLLAEMDPVDLDARGAAARAAAARGLSAQRSAEAQVADARSRQALAAAEAARYQDLLRQNFVSSSVVDSKQQALKSADAQLAAADAALAAARQDVARLGAEQQALGQQRANLRLLAPADGVVTAREAEPGSTVVAGQAVLRLQQPGSLWVTTRFDQARATGLAEGLPALIRLRSAPERALPGKVLRVEPVADSVTEERIAQITFDAPPAGVSTKEMAEVTVALPVVPKARVLPNAALKTHQGRSGVWLLDGERLRFAPVRTGARGPDGAVQVLDGLPADARVVVYSERALSADTRVRVVERLAGTAP